MRLVHRAQEATFLHFLDNWDKRCCCDCPRLSVGQLKMWFNSPVRLAVLAGLLSVFSNGLTTYCSNLSKLSHFSQEPDFVAVSCSSLSSQMLVLVLYSLTVQFNAERKWRFDFAITGSRCPCLVGVHGLVQTMFFLLCFFLFLVCVGLLHSVPSLQNRDDLHSVTVPEHSHHNNS